MKKLSKVLFATVLTLSLFMICGYANAQVAGGGRCTNETCYISYSQIDESHHLLVDPELLTLGENETAYLLTVGRNVEYFDSDGVFNIKITTVNEETTIDKILGFVPISNGAESFEEHKTYSAYTFNYFADSFYFNEDGGLGSAPIGYLVVTNDFNMSDYSVGFYANYSNWYGSDLTINGIEYLDSDNGYVSTDIFFGDFRFDYVVDSANNSFGTWKSVNTNSGKVIIDNTKSTLDLNCKFIWDSEESQIGLDISESSIGAGDVANDIVLRSLGFVTTLGEKKEFDILPAGGNSKVVKELLNNGGYIGHLSLIISSEEIDYY